MAKLVPCKSCNKEVSKTAYSCPHCGHKLRSVALNLLGWAFFLFIAFHFIRGFLNPAAVHGATPASMSTPSNASPADTSWNTTDPDAMSNGNIQRAARHLQSASSVGTVDQTDAESVIKAPWKYYGTMLCFSGEVAVVEDQPPGNPIARALGAQETAEVVIEHDDGTILDFFVIGNSGSLKVGDIARLCGLPAGRTDVPNQVGGAFTHLVLIGRIS